jgi:hypothetical protein
MTMTMRRMAATLAPFAKSVNRTGHGLAARADGAFVRGGWQ